MKTAAYILAAAAGCAAITGCATTGGTGADTVAASQERMTVSGSIAYREKIALAPGSTATITLNDISLADAPSRMISEQTIDLTGQQVPIDFALAVPAGKLDQRHRYSVRATIAGPGGQMMWTTDTAHIIDPDAANQDIGMLGLVRVAPPIAENPLKLGKQWVVEDIDGNGIIDNSRVTLKFSEDGRISGRAGCNNFSGSYTLDGRRLTIAGPLALTRKLCPPALMLQERRFVDTLRTKLRVSPTKNGALTLTGDSGKSILAR